MFIVFWKVINRVPIWREKWDFSSELEYYWLDFFWICAFLQICILWWDGGWSRRGDCFGHEQWSEDGYWLKHESRNKGKEAFNCARASCVWARRGHGGGQESINQSRPSFSQIAISSSKCLLTPAMCARLIYKVTKGGQTRKGSE